LDNSEGSAEQPFDPVSAQLRYWRPAKITYGLRQRNPGAPPVGRWESLLRAEQSLAQRLVPALARRHRLGRMLGIPPAVGNPRPISIADRERRLRAVRRTRIGRLLERLVPERAGEALPVASDGFPPVGPALSREIDRALELLKEAPLEELQRRGWHLEPNTWLSPLNDLPFLRANPDLWLRERWPEAIDFDLDGQEQLLRRLATHAGELGDMATGQSRGPAGPVWNTAIFPLGDAYAYYGLVRELRPKRVIEVGAGSSSIVLARAVAANEGGTEVTLIEPYPNDAFLSALPDGWRLVPEIVQRVDLNLFDQLEAGDILFYDGSHCVRTASDVNWMFFEVLPRLKAGVWIHVHDITWPFDYPLPLLIDNAMSWNEQYLVQAFLMYNQAFRLRFSFAGLIHARRELVEALLPNALIGGSIWMEKVA
jgi:hypothetical protein